jgi:hypothetical protein
LTPCRKADVKPTYEYIPDDTPFNVVRDRVVAANLMRRHLTTGQRAMTAAALATMTVGGTGSNQHEKSKRENSTDSKSNGDAAKTLSVSPSTVKTAKAIKRDAPDLAEEVSKGNMTLNLVVRCTSVITPSTIGVCRSFLILIQRCGSV